MNTLTDAFDYTQDGFADGNLMYYTVEGNRHDYQYTYKYIFTESFATTMQRFVFVA